MSPFRIFVCSLALTLFFVARSQAQVAEDSTDRPPAVTSLDATGSVGQRATPATLPRKGGWAAEIAGAILGDWAAMAITTAIIVPEYCDGDCDDSPLLRRAFGIGAASRVLLVGSLTAACARPRDGQGTVWAAMLGAMPGAALLFGGWYVPDEATAVMVAVGHVGTVVGAVLSYRASARRRHAREQNRALSVLTPIPKLDRGAAQLSWQGRF